MVITVFNNRSDLFVKVEFRVNDDTQNPCAGVTQSSLLAKELEDW